MNLHLNAKRPPRFPLSRLSDTVTTDVPSRATLTSTRPTCSTEPGHAAAEPCTPGRTRKRHRPRDGRWQGSADRTLQQRGQCALRYSGTRRPCSCDVSFMQQSDVTDAQRFHASDLLEEESELGGQRSFALNLMDGPPRQESGGPRGQPEPPKRRVTESGEDEGGRGGVCREVWAGRRACVQGTEWTAVPDEHLSAEHGGGGALAAPVPRGQFSSQMCKNFAKKISKIKKKTWAHPPN